MTHSVSQGELYSKQTPSLGLGSISQYLDFRPPIRVLSGRMPPWIKLGISIKLGRYLEVGFQLGLQVNILTIIRECIELELGFQHSLARIKFSLVA